MDHTAPTFIPQVREILERLAQLPLDSKEQEIVAGFQREAHQLLMAEGYLLEELKAAAAYVEANVEARNLRLAKQQIIDTAEAAQEESSYRHSRWMATKERILAERYPTTSKVTEFPTSTGSTGAA